MNHFIYTLFSGAALLLAFLLIANPNKVNNKGNWWFGWFVLCLFMVTVGDSLQITHVDLNENIVNLISLAAFIIAPVFYLSVCYFIEPGRKWKKTDFLHFGFGFVMLLLTLLLMLVDNSKYQKTTHSETDQIVGVIFNLICFFQLIQYVIVSYRKIVKHRKNILYFASSVESVDLKWLQYIGVGVASMSFIWALEILFQLSGKSVVYDTFSNLIYLINVLFIAYYSMKQKEIYPFDAKVQDEIMDIVWETELPLENRKKLLPDDKLEETKAELIDLMDSKKPFLDCELSLVKLADLMNTSTHLLSYVINTGFNENFYQFVNRYRIEESKKLLLDPNMNHLSLVGIGYEVGFNSKTVFNTTFKKMTEFTPTEFKKTSNRFISAN